jgi:hypothetical protein
MSCGSLYIVCTYQYKYKLFKMYVMTESPTEHHFEIV